MPLNSTKKRRSGSEENECDGTTRSLEISSSDGSDASLNGGNQDDIYDGNQGRNKSQYDQPFEEEKLQEKPYDKDAGY